MLIQRGMRCLAFYCRPAPLYTWSIRVRNPALEAAATSWYVKTPTTTMTAVMPMSTNRKEILNPFIILSKRTESTAAATKPQQDVETETKPKLTTPLTNQAPIIEIPTIMNNPQPLPQSPPPPVDITASQKAPSPPLNTPPKPNIPNDGQDGPRKSESNMPPLKPPMADTRLQPPNIKMPSREQLEKYFFTALVYVWDFCYYIFNISLRLIDTYIVKNPTLQENWNKLLKRLEEQRQALKSKK